MDEDDAIRDNLEKNFEVVWSNIKGMRESLKKKPCGCGGVNPIAVIAERKNNLEKFCITWISSLKTEELELLKTCISSHIVLKVNNGHGICQNDEVLLEI